MFQPCLPTTGNSAARKDSNREYGKYSRGGYKQAKDTTTTTITTTTTSPGITRRLSALDPRKKEDREAYADNKCVIGNDGVRVDEDSGWDVGEAGDEGGAGEWACQRIRTGVGRKRALLMERREADLSVRYLMTKVIIPLKLMVFLKGQPQTLKFALAQS